MIKKLPKVRVRLFKVRNFIFFNFFILLVSCSSTLNKTGPRDLAIRVALKAARPAIEKIFFAEAPVSPPSQSQLPLVNQLPGRKAFNSTQYQKKSISYDSGGALLLLPGDYTIPVMTFCMKLNGTSPSSHIYALSILKGTRAKIIHDLNLKAIPQFSPNDVQILSWSLQAGLSYEEMSSKSKQIVDAMLPESRGELHESFLNRFEKKWNQVSDNSAGLIPSFNETSDELLNDLGEVGESISKIRNFRRNILEFGNDYSALSKIIEIKKNFVPTSQTTSWSKVSDRVYARFVTNGSFQELGKIQIRILSSHKKRSPGSEVKIKTLFDLGLLIADPQNLLIQPLSFAMILSSQGVLLVPAIAETPLIAAAILSAILASEVIDWDIFGKLSHLLINIKDARVRELIQNGNTTLKKEHDELEKPARDAGVINNKTKNSTSKAENNTREYNKPGGIEALQKDFDKITGELTKTQDGTETKTLPDGKTVVKRLVSKKDQSPTLEIQPPKGNIKENNKLRIKVRYY